MEKKNVLRLTILIFIIFFQACTPTSNQQIVPFLISLLQEKEIGPIALYENLDSLDPESFRENSVNLEWSLLYGGGPHKLTKDSTLAVGENGFIYVAADTNSDPLYERFINKVIVGKKLLLRKYNSQKNEIWLNQMGSPSINFDVAGIAVDSKGNTYITGSKSSSVNELDSDRNQYLFVFKVNSDGSPNWIKETGPAGGIYEVNPRKITVDTFGNSYIIGTSNGPFGGDSARYGNGFIIKFDTDGNQIWVKQLSIEGSNILPTGVVFDKLSGNIYVCGSGHNANFKTNTNPGIGQDDLFILKYDQNGNRQFFAQLGSALGSVFGNTITVDRFGNVLVGAYSNIDFTLGEKKESPIGTIVKYNSSGVQQWIRQFGPGSRQKSTVINEITTDRAGNIFTTGSTSGFIKFGDSPSEGKEDVFVTKHSSSGEVLKLWQWGNIQEYMIGSGIDLDGNLYTTGWTTSDLFQNKMRGTIDTFLMKFR
ncbi:beta-propeller repeat protein [Leptospira noguchii str. 2006001870]|uniref:SBBP repeat beta-propeller lipoprotein, LipL53 family n=1 Tax=Leptospira noguchii TaxID=28182 RepID=UPI000248B83A|nr:SBBP repeat-containing protein [Leptospira noguchii]EKR73649.1 beta-propeller repeat protein [Leptospira noguchii str. 2006001870]